MILADTSAWVEYDQATDSTVDRRVVELIERGGELAVTEPVVMEVVAGARDEMRERDLRRLMSHVDLVPFNSPDDFDAATSIYRTCRRRGVTPRGMVDCMIAAVGWRVGAVLLSADLDLARVAGVIGLDLDPASLRA